MRNCLVIGISVVWIATTFPDGARAEITEGAELRYGDKINLNRRYPGDRVLDDGHVRTKGPDQGPYVERCRWYARETFLGLSWGFVQRCQRYTLENTQ